MTKKIFDNIYLNIIFIFILYIAINYQRLQFNTFNLEWFFVELINYFKTPEYYFNIELFQRNQANSSIYSFILKTLSPNFLNNYENLYYFRIINVFSILSIFLFAAKLKISNNSNIKYLLILFIFCPIVNIYLFRIYPDILSFACASFSFLLLSRQNNWSIFFSIIFATIAFLLKPVAIIIFPLFAYYIWGNKNLKKNITTLLIIYSSVLAIAYFSYLTIFDIKIFSEYYADTYIKFNLINSIKNFISYVNYSTLLIFPFVFFFFIQFFIHQNVDLNSKIIVLFISLASSFLLKNISGEMNYGYLNQLFTNSSLMTIITIFNNLLSITFIYLIYKNGDKHQIQLINLFLIILVILSILIARPVQRYLIYPLPIIFYLAILLHKKQFIKKILMFCYLIFFVSVTTGQYIYQIKTNRIINQFKSHVINNNLTNNTHPGTLYHSIGYLFKDYVKNIVFDKNNVMSDKYNYKIDQCNNKNILKYKLVIFKKKIDEFCLNKK